MEVRPKMQYCSFEQSITLFVGVLSGKIFQVHIVNMY